MGENTMKIHRIALAVAAGLVLAGCLPVTTKTPVGTTAGLGADPALIGSWIARSKDQEDKNHKDIGVAYFHFLQIKGAGAINVLWVSASDRKGDNGWMSFSASTAKLGAYNYLNAIWLSENGKPAGDNLKEANFPLLYSFGGDRRLTLYLLDEDKAKEAIKAGKIAGTIEPGNFGDVKITAAPGALDAFFATPEAAKLFKVFIVLRRVE